MTEVTGKVADMFGGTIMGRKLKDAYVPDRRITLVDRVLAQLIVRGDRGIAVNSAAEMFGARRIAPAIQTLREHGWNISTEDGSYILRAIDE